MTELLLRLQDERDEAIQAREDWAEAYCRLLEAVTQDGYDALLEERDDLNGQMQDWKRWCEDAEAARDKAEEERDHALSANQMYRLEMGQAYDDMKVERDALLEALKSVEAIADIAMGETEPKYLEGALREVAGTARSAIANVEGKE